MSLLGDPPPGNAQPPPPLPWPDIGPSPPILPSPRALCHWLLWWLQTVVGRTAGSQLFWACPTPFSTYFGGSPSLRRGRPIRTTAGVDVATLEPGFRFASAEHGLAEVPGIPQSPPGHTGTFQTPACWNSQPLGFLQTVPPPPPIARLRGSGPSPNKSAAALAPEPQPLLHLAPEWQATSPFRLCPRPPLCPPHTPRPPQHRTAGPPVSVWDPFSLTLFGGPGPLPRTNCVAQLESRFSLVFDCPRLRCAAASPDGCAVLDLHHRMLKGDSARRRMNRPPVVPGPPL